MRGTLFCLTILATVAFNANAESLKLVNHFGKDLKVIVGRNPEVLSDFQKEFILANNHTMSSRFSMSNKEAYLRAEDTANNYGFFGVELRDQNVNVHGYLSRGLAYSWDQGVITFCTPSFYIKRNGCI